MKRNEQFWTEVEHLNIRQAQTFSELVPVALAVLERMPKPLSQVCGPISTGGLGSIKRNLAVFDATIDHIMRQDISVFDQMPFNEHILRIVNNKWVMRHNNMLLEEFYRPVFMSRHVSRLYFIHDWQSSEGARWEHELGQQLGLQIVYLKPNLVAVE